MNPEQQAAWAILQSAFSFVAGELRQRWQLAREAKSNPATPEKPKPEVSESIQTEAQAKLTKLEDAFALKMMSGSLKSAMKVAENNHRRWNKLREQIPLVSPSERVTLELQMENTAQERDVAITEMKDIIQTLLEQEIVIESPKA